MKVYIRRWKGDQRNYISEGPYMIDSYNGISFEQDRESPPPPTAVVLHETYVHTIYLHASEPNALVVYVEDVEIKEETI